MNRLSSMVRNLVRRRRVERDLDDEVRAHLQMLADEKIVAGMSPEEAWRAARMEAEIEAVKEEVRSGRAGALLDRCVRDLRIALRGLRNNPRFAATAILALALGIGASTVIFSVFYNLFFDPLTARDADRLVVPVLHDYEGRAISTGDAWQCPAGDLEVVRRANAFEQVVGYVPWGVVLVGDGRQTFQFYDGQVTDDAFEFYGVRPLLGRGLVPGDGKPGAPPVFVLSYQTWKQEFHSDPATLGRSFTVNGEPRTLVGVMPARFHVFGALDQLWLPLPWTPGSPPPQGEPSLLLLARLKQGVTAQAASAELDGMIRRLAAQSPEDFPKQFAVEVVPVRDFLLASSSGPFFRTDLRKMLWALLGAALMVLLISCANVAILLLSRAAVRQREMAVRTALGASRSRITLQLIIEAAVLAGAACALGCVLAWFGTSRANEFLYQPAVSSLSSEVLIRLSLPVLAFAITLAMLTTLICGLAPAAYVWRRDIQHSLVGSGKNQPGDLRHATLRSGLVIAEVALSLVLLIGAALLMLSFHRLTHVDLGFNPRHVLLMVFGPVRPHSILPDRARMATPRWQASLQEMMERMRRVPGVEGVAIDNTIPGYGPTTGPQVMVPGGARSEVAGIDECDENCLRTLQFRLLRGRWFSREEVQSGQLVTVLTQMLSRDLFGDGDPVGQQLLVKGWFTSAPGKPTWPPPATTRSPKQDAYLRIIGVVGDVANGGPQQAPIPMAFTPPLQSGGLLLQVRTSVDPASLMHTLQEQIWAVDPNEVFWVYQPLSAYLQQYTYASPQMAVAMFAPMAAIALLLVVVGVFSVTAYNVSLRTQEFGIRAALGAQQSDILAMVVRRGMSLIGAGGFLGVVLSLGMARLLSSQLWGVSPHDPAIFTLVVAMLAAAGLAACLIPARRAARVDPMVALRYE